MSGQRFLHSVHVPVTVGLEDALLPEEELDDYPLDDAFDALLPVETPDSGDALFNALSLIVISSVVMLSPCDAPAESDSGNAKARIALAPVTLKAMTPRPATAPTHVPIAARRDGS